MSGPDDVLQYFVYDHLPEEFQGVSKWFYSLAIDIVQSIPRCPQRTIALNKLLECKDAAVRAAMWKEPS